MATRTTQHENFRAGRAGTAMVGAAALALIPSYFAWQWVTQTKPFADNNINQLADSSPGPASAETTDADVVSESVEKGDVVDMPVGANATNDAAPPTEEAAAPSLLGPALNSADGVPVFDANQRNEEDGRGALAAASRERQILRAYRPALPSVFQMRQWTANDGAVAYATYLGRVGSDVMLQDSDGKKFRIPRDRLSEQDQELLLSLD